MGLPYEIANYLITVDDADEFWPVPFPNRVELVKLLIFSSQATATVDVYNRQLKRAAVNVIEIVDNGAGKTRLRLATSLPLNVGDPVVVATNSVGGYNTTHRVTATDDDYLIIDTDQTYSANGTGGTATFEPVAAEANLYRVLAQQSITSNALSLIDDDGVDFVNHDPPSNKKALPGKHIYLKFSATGTYRVTLGASSPESQAF